jgi:O-antigen ligase
MRPLKKHWKDQLLFTEDKCRRWGARLDKVGVVTGFLVPVGLVLGNVGFEVMIGLGGGCWIARLILLRDRSALQTLKHPMVIAWFVWYMCMVISLLANGPGSKGWAHDIVFFRYLLFTVSLLDISKRLPVGRYLLYGLATGVGWAALNTLSAYLIGFDLIGKPLIRYTGKLKEASRIAGMSAYAVPVFLTWGILDQKLSPRMKTLLIGIGLTAFFQLLQTTIRTGIISAMAGVFFAAVFLVRRRVSTRVAVGLVFGLIAAVWLFFSYGRMWNLATIYDRVYYWKVTWAMWQDHPIVGVGISSFQDAYKAMAASGRVGAFAAPDGVVYRLPEQTHAHNIFFMIISCSGLLGLAAFTGLFTTAVQSIFKNFDGYRVALVSWPVVFLTIGMTGFNIYHSWYQALFGFFMVLIGSRWVETDHG